MWWPCRGVLVTTSAIIEIRLCRTGTSINLPLAFRRRRCMCGSKGTCRRENGGDVSQRRKIGESICVSSSGLTGRYIVRSRHCRRLHLCRNLLPHAQREWLESVACRRHRSRTDKVAELRLLHARLVSDCHNCHSARRACVLNCLASRSGSRSWLLRAFAGFVAWLVACEAEALMLFSFRLPALGCAVSFAIAIHTSHISAATRRHHPGRAIGQLRLTTAAGPLLELPSRTAACRRKVPSLHEG